MRWWRVAAPIGGMFAALVALNHMPARATLNATAAAAALFVFSLILLGLEVLDRILPAET